MTKRILILGASGRFGRHAEAAFEAAGWEVTRFNRKTDDYETAMQGKDIVLNAMNPGGYQDWPELLVPLHEAVAKAAAKTGVPVILPGNVYVFGPKAPFGWTADSPHLAENELGRLRIAAETAYPKAGARVIILRCGDFLDTVDTGNWFEHFITKPLAKGRIAYPGDPDVPHAWAWLPDAARAAVALAEIAGELTPVEDVPFEGYTLSGREMAAVLTAVTGGPVRVTPFPWWQLRLIAPFAPLVKRVLEMRYLWSLPQRLDGAKLAGLVPEFRATPAREALAKAVAFRLDQ